MKTRVLSLLTAAMALTMVASPVFAAGSARPTHQPAAPDGPPGLPFTEDFSDSTLQDPALTNANWSTEEQALILGWRRKQFGAFGPGLTGSNITGDAGDTRSVALGDVDGDGDLDVVAGNQSQPNRLYLNNGAGTSWTASDITGDADSTFSVALGDVDGDGDLDLLAGNYNQVNRLYLNNGTADPWNGVLGSDITADTGATNSVALGDVDRDGDLDLVAGNYNQINRLYRRVLFHTAHGRAGSLRVDTETDPIAKVVLTGTVSLPINTGVTYWLSNTGGARWFQVRSGVPFIFPTAGADLRWRADLGSLSPVRTPRVDQIEIALACLADVNGSGGVDIVDVQLVAGAFGTNVPAYDFNRSGLVDVLDIQYVADAWPGGC